MLRFNAIGAANFRLSDADAELRIAATARRIKAWRINALKVTWFARM